MPRAEGAAPPRDGFWASLRGAGATLLDLLHTRLELLATELDEGRLRLLAVLGWGTAAVLLLCMGLGFLAVFLTVLLWDSHRLLVLGVMSSLFLAGGLAALWLARRPLADAPPLLAGSLAELAADAEALRRLHERP
ncbi:phage holin family protein [Caldimonas tepidiphila]|uniref:phage holin family protein n=1 Tax=Caldimonas tepidiphila TaxID=2315841 RepID=UPI000E5AD96E|nr:phage holin family protein [Caldimonas tepidiphila]